MDKLQFKPAYTYSQGSAADQDHDSGEEPRHGKVMFKKKSIKENSEVIHIPHKITRDLVEKPVA